MRDGRERAARKRLVAGLVAVALLAGCTSSDDEPDPGAVESSEPVAGGALRLGIGGPLVVDPVDASLASSSDLMVLDLLYDGLTRLDDQGAPQPALAAEWGANEDFTAFRFRLDSDATFASGRPVTPDDVISSLERVMAAGDSSLAALSLEAVEGFRAFADGEADGVSGLTAPDERTVRFGLTTPLSTLPQALSSPVLSVVDPESIDGDVAETDLSGAWEVAGASGGDLTLERRVEADGEGLGSVELRAYDSPEAAYDAFDDGGLDWAPVPASRYERALADHGDGAFAPFQAELFFGMNLRASALRTPAMRQAIRLAIDRDAIVEEVYADLADPLSTVVPAGVAGHDPGRCPACTLDPEQAADIVAFLHPDGDVPTVRLDYDESPAQEEMARLVAEDLNDVGIPTRLQPRPLEEYESFIVSGDQALFSFGWIGAYGSPDAYLAPLFGSAANDNLTRFRSPQVDGLLERARAGSDPADNAERWALAEELVLESAVVVPIAQFRTQVVVSERVEGLVHAVDGTVDWSQVRLSA